MVGSKRILVTPSRDGQIRAVSSTCTHMGCSITSEPDRADGELSCNCHESRYAVRGENISGAATRSLDQYRIEAVGGHLIVAEVAEDRE